MHICKKNFSKNICVCIALLCIQEYLFATEKQNTFIEKLGNFEDVQNARFEIPEKLLEEYFHAQKAAQENPQPDTPVTSIVTSWNARIEVENDLTTTTIAATAEIFDATADKPYYWKLFPDNTVFNSVFLNKEKVKPLDIQRWYQIQITKPGKYTVTSEIISKPKRNLQGYSLKLANPGALISSVEIDSKQNLEFWIENTPGKVRGDPKSGTHGEIFTGNLIDLNLHWNKSQLQFQRTGIPIVTPNIFWQLDEKSLIANSLLDIRILNGSISEMEISLPPQSDKVNLTGTDVRDFRFKNNRLKIFFKGAIKGKIRLNLQFEMPRPKSEILKLPVLKISNGRLSDNGWIIVSNQAGGELLETDSPGLEPVYIDRIPPEIQAISTAKPQFAFMITKRNAIAQFDWFQTSPFPMTDTICDLMEINSVFRSGGEEMTQIKFKIRNRQRQFMRLRMPPDSILLNVKVENQPRDIVQEGNEILIPLEKSIQTLEGLISFPVEIIYTRQNNSFLYQQNAKVDLPELNDIPVANSKVTVFIPEEMSIRKSQSVLQMVDSWQEGKESFTYGYGYSFKSEPKNEIDKETDDIADQIVPKRKKKKRNLIPQINLFPTYKSWRKASQPKSDHRSLATAIESYEFDAETSSHFDALDLSKTGQILLKAREVYSDGDESINFAESTAGVTIAGGSFDVNGLSPESDPLDRKSEKPPVLKPKPKRSVTLGRNYYQLGYKAYKEKRLTEAEEYLGKAIENAPDDSIATEARQLLSNFTTVNRGYAESIEEGELGTEAFYAGAFVVKESKKALAPAPEKRGKETRAKAAAIRGEIQADALQLEIEREELLQSGLEKLNTGDRIKGLREFQLAQGRQLELNQRGIRNNSEVQLNEQINIAEQNERYNRKLRRRLSELQRQREDRLERSAGQSLAYGIQAPAQKTIDQKISGRLALWSFGSEETGDLYTPGPTQERLGLAKQIEDLAAKPVDSLEDFNVNLVTENTLLTQNISQLEELIEKESQESKLPKLSEHKHLTNRFFKSNQPASGTAGLDFFGESKPEEESPQFALVQPESSTSPVAPRYEWLDDSGNIVDGTVFDGMIQLDSSVYDSDFDGRTSIEWSIEEPKTRYSEQNGFGFSGEVLYSHDSTNRTTSEGDIYRIKQDSLEKSEQPAQVDFDLEGIVDQPTPHQAGQLADFLFSNAYFAPPQISSVTLGVSDGNNVTGNDVDVKIIDPLSYANGQIIALNEPDNVDRINESLQALRDNAGQVVTFGCQDLNIENASQQGIASNWFRNQFSNGIPYAVLDEAQYKTLLNLNNENEQRRDSQINQRDLIVGTGNQLGDVTINLDYAGIGSNDLNVYGEEINLKQNNYLVLDNGSFLTVYRGGESRQWQEIREEELLEQPEEIEFELPRIGKPIYFEKTFLAAGESPDINIEYTIKEKK